MKMDAATMPGSSGALAEWRKGWPVVLAAGLGYGSGGAMVLLLASLFIKPMRDALGWSTSAVTIAPIVTLTWALCYPLAGWAIDRAGSRRVAIAGATGLAACAALLSFVPVSAGALYTLAALIGVFASLTAVPTYTRAVASWFSQGVGLAFGITLSGSALVSIFATPLVGSVIADHGWRMGFLALAAIVAGVGLPVILLFYRERPRAVAVAAAPASGASMAEALRDIRFWGYLSAFALACVALGGFVGHVQPILAEKDFPLAEALSLGVCYALAISVGKIVIGILLDRVWPFAVAAAVSTLAGVGAVALSMAGVSSGFAFAAAAIIAIGLGQGAEADFVAYFALRSFGVRAYARIVGLLGMMSTVGLAIGGFLFAQLVDRNGDYDAACLIGAACLVGSGMILLMTGVSDRRRKGAD